MRGYRMWPVLIKSFKSLTGAAMTITEAGGVVDCKCGCACSRTGAAGAVEPQTVIFSKTFARTIIT